MRKLSNYVATTVTASICMVLLVILGLDAIAALIDEMPKLRHNYTFLAALRFVLLSTPGALYEFLPFGALVGCLAGLGTLANNSELVVMRSAGISTSRVVWMVMKPALVIMFFGVLISEYIAPHSQNIAQSHRATAMLSTDKLVSRHGLWHREGNQFMHFNVVQPNGMLFGVTMYTFDDQRHLLKSLYADRAIYQNGHWLLEDTSESFFKDGHVEKVLTPSKVWNSELSPALLNILVLDPLDLPTQGLWKYSKYLESQGLNSLPYDLAFWKKVLQPLSTVTLVLVAISFVFGPLREVTMGFRIFTGVLVGIGFRTAQDILVPASMVYNFAPIYASLIPIVICAVIGVVLLRRAN